MMLSNTILYDTDMDNASLMYAGVMSLGIGDTFASLVGVTIGRHRWPS